jgi:amidophosphoribosyltransferase
MAKMGDFIAFEAAIELLRDRGMEYVIDDVYKKCQEQLSLPKGEYINYVKEIYAPFTDEEVSAKIATLLTPESIKAKVEIIYQTVDNLHLACPKNLGDWYFTGNYPTAGGNKVVCKAFMNWVEGKNVRAY